jgi:uncharacterized lipoprotein YajG
MKKCLLPLSVCLLFIATACSTQMRVTLVEPELTPNKAERYLTKQCKVVVEPFVMKDKDKQERGIGDARLGALNYPGHIISEENVSVFLTRAVSKGFAASGFAIAEKEQADYLVSAIVDRFWVDEYATGLSLEYARAAVRYDLMVKKPKGKTIWASTLESYKTSSRSMDATEDDIPTLMSALKETIEAIFSNESFWEAIARDSKEKE